MCGIYTLSSTDPQNETPVGVNSGDLGGRGMQLPRPVRLRRNGSVPRHIPVIVGRGPILLPSHTVYIVLCNKEVLQHI
jgi:hypothetical protein